MTPIGVVATEGFSKIFYVNLCHGQQSLLRSSRWRTVAAGWASSKDSESWKYKESISKAHGKVPHNLVVQSGIVLLLILKTSVVT